MFAAYMYDYARRAVFEDLVEAEAKQDAMPRSLEAARLLI